MKKISLEELRQMRDKGGLVLQGCGGDPQEWVDGINKLLTDEGILKNGSTFHEVYSFENKGLTCLLFDMEGVKLPFDLSLMVYFWKRLTPECWARSMR